ncbi:ABC transporter substrate-binding protein [Reinekea blandensis]|uniref:ABC transporter, periplasmic component n=1 Tax=Reinekea blandensis MED297 TaxID=314283 RepID=A4BK56_9GAMM|nr:ABC transporter substrate-binding protein [Reinekea blandensis]EAR07485.1 ABC transporter, periplasmic component [Reinekea sp. MED297] [Reinekea blandensis MED297]
MPTLIRLITIALMALLAAPLWADTTYPLTVRDGMDHALTLRDAPDRVSSKTLFTDEILLDLIDPERLSSLTNIAADEHYSNVADHLPAGVPLLDLNVEAILNNYPDLVFAANWSDAGIVEQLRQAGISVYLVNTPFTLEQIQAEIRKIGRLVDAETRAEQLIESMNADLAALADAHEQIRAANLTALDYNSWGTASGVDTTWQAVLDATGLINGTQAFEQGAFGQVSMSKELIVDINPDVLFLPGWIYGESDGADAFYHQVINDPALSEVKAIQTGRVYPVPEHLRGTYSQYIIDTIEYVTSQVQQDL